MRSSFRRRSMKKVGIGLLIISMALLLISSAGIVFLWSQCREENKQLQAQLNSCRKLLYVAETDLGKGMVLTREHVRLEERYTDEVMKEYITEAAFGKVLLTDVSKGSCLMKSMLGVSQAGEREVFLSEIFLPDNLSVGNRIDVRIGFSNAEDYIVLADKVIVALEENGLILRLKEEEILYLSSAMVDSRVYEEVTLYAVKYPEKEQLLSSGVTYVPNREILMLLDRESVEGESRAALEKRLLQEMDK